jgi:hypothetical protein
MGREIESSLLNYLFVSRAVFLQPFYGASVRSEDNSSVEPCDNGALTAAAMSGDKLMTQATSKSPKKQRAAKMARLSINARERRRMHDLVSILRISQISVSAERVFGHVFSDNFRTNFHNKQTFI